MNTETVSAIKDALTPIAEKIGQGAEFGWEVVVRQQYAEGIAALMGAAFAAAVALAGIYLINRALKEPKVRRYSYDDRLRMKESAELVLGAGVFLQTAWVVAFLAAANGIMQILNPHYYALKFFVELAGKTIN